MIRLLEEKQGYDAKYVELACDIEDVDALPNKGIAQGSIALVLDGASLAVYMFSEDDGAWVELGSGGSSSSGVEDDV